MKKLIFRAATVFAAVTGAGSLFAETFVWTGAGTPDANGRYAFTNAANWKISGTGAAATRCPGMLYDANDRAGSWESFYAHPSDEVHFGNLTGVAAQAIDLTGHGSVSNVCFDAGTTAYTFHSFPLGIAVCGTLTVDAGVETMPVFNYGLGMGMGVTKAMSTTANLISVYIVNNKSGSTLDLPVLTSGAPDNTDDVHYGDYYFRGPGNVRLGRIDSTSYMVNSKGLKVQYVHRALHFENGGKVTFYKSSIGTLSDWSYVRNAYFDTTADAGEVEIEKNAWLWVQDGSYQGFRFSKDYRVYGAGWLGLTGDRPAQAESLRSATPILVAAGKTVKIETMISFRVNGSIYRSNMLFYGNKGEETYTGTVDLSAVVTNKANVAINTYHPATVKVTGIDGDRTVVSNAFGTATLALSGGSILAYAGPGEATVREITLTNAVGFGQTGTTEAQATLSQRGTGLWIVSNVVNAADSTHTATLTLDNDTAVDAELAAALADNRAASRCTDIVKTGSGKWILSAENTTGGKLTIQEGEIEESATGRTGNMTYFLDAGTTLRLLGNGTSRQMNLLTAQSGASTVALGAGTTVRLNALPVTTGGTVDFVLDSGAVLEYPSGKGTYLPVYVTLNGKRAFVGGDGKIVEEGSPIVPSSSIGAKGGVITNGETIVGITCEGTTGPITLSDAATAINMLIDRTETDATISIGADETLSVKSVTMEENAGALTIEAAEGGGLTTTENQILVFKNDSEAALTVTAPLTVPAGASIEKSGAGTVALPGTGSWSSDLTLSGGALSVGSLTLASLSENAGCSVAVSGADQSVETTSGTLRLSGTSPDGGRGDLVVSAGTLQIADGARLTTDTVKVAPADGATEAKLVITGGASVYFPETNGVFEIGSFTETTSAATAEVSVVNGSIGAVFNPNHLKDEKTFANYRDRAVLVGTPYSHGILRVGPGGAITNRLVLGHAYHCGACYMDGGEIVSLGGYSEGGSDRYTQIGFGGSNSGTWAWKGKGEGYYEQKSGRFFASESLQISAYHADGVFMMTGGSGVQQRHPDSDLGAGSAYFTLVTGDGNGVFYIGNGATWDAKAFAYMLDQGAGQPNFTVDSGARVSLGSSDQLDICYTIKRLKPLFINVNNAFLSCRMPRPNSSLQPLKVYSSEGVRTNTPSYFNLNGAVVNCDYRNNHEITLGFYNNHAYPIFNRICVYENGATLCLTNYCSDSGHLYANINCPIEGATGKGVASVELGEPIAGYIVPPTVEIEGDGEGASAVALFDSATGLTTNILVTSAGYDYVEPPVAKLYIARALVRTVPCTLKENVPGKLTIRHGNASHGVIPYVKAALRVPVVEFAGSGWRSIYVDDAIPTNTTVILSGGGPFAFSNLGSFYTDSRPYVIRGTGDTTSTLSSRPCGEYVTQAVAVDGSDHLGFNNMSNRIVGCTKVDCATLAQNRADGVVPVIDNQKMPVVLFDTTATMAFSNTDALDPDAHVYPICQLSQTQQSSAHVFTGLPTAVGLPSGWMLEQSAGQLRLRKRRGVLILFK